MHYVSDFHLHSKYSRAVSQQMVLPFMAQTAREKGIDLLTVSDWTHPLWFKEIQGQIEEAGEGVYRLKSQNSNDPFRRSDSEASKYQISNENKEPKFILSTEISSIYKQGDKLRRIHNLIFAPDLVAAENIAKALVDKGCNLKADGRPVIGLTSKALFELILSVDERSILIPCHVWTPHFGVYGSASGFDSLDEAFGDLAGLIIGVETGLSSDPEMNWQIEELADRSILSFSDAHSPAKMAREATVLELGEVSYKSIIDAMTHTKEKKVNRVVYTIEFYPEEGKYHFSGHRNCKVVFTPDEVSEKGTTCPVCGKRLTEGVFFRLQSLSGREELTKSITKPNDFGLTWYTDPMRNHPPYVKLVGLLQIVAEALSSTVMSMKVKTLYGQIIKTLGPELSILLKTPREEIVKAGGEKVAEGVMKVRKGEISIAPGYDGEYGKVSIWAEDENNTQIPQLSLEF